jgi:hypothetical protein
MKQRWQAKIATGQLAGMSRNRLALNSSRMAEERNGRIRSEVTGRNN